MKNLVFFIVRSRYFERGLEGFKFGSIFFVKIIISRKDPAKNYKICFFFVFMMIIYVLR